MAFLFLTMDENFKSVIPGKVVLDVACGKGIYFKRLVQHGAKVVHGFDLDEEMVKLTKQSASQFDEISVCVGDVKNMPFNDNIFVWGCMLLAICQLRCVSRFSKKFTEF